MAKTKKSIKQLQAEMLYRMERKRRNKNNWTIISKNVTVDIYGQPTRGDL
jgi:hypothetical protein